jgi:hypothetical protein
MFSSIILIINIGSFNETIFGRVQTLTNLNEDTSFNDRKALYSGMIDTALSSYLGQGMGVITGSLDSGILALLLTFGWLGSIPYLIGLTMLLSKVAQSNQHHFDPFMKVTRALSIGVLVVIASNNVLAGIKGMVLWGFLGITMAAYKYHNEMLRREET